ncbi:VOC family protein [Glutamicibacter sp.]|uniref:VOC family protein n=1 Tax=Glutamicibacter sp. TaxID=1931995 RepID=UPI0028BE78FD|nr:VOC family protein [Glutamicibacter sp.]
MYLENIVFDAVRPRDYGQFFERLLGCTQLTDSEHGYETRARFDPDFALDLCFPTVEQIPERTGRLRLLLRGRQELFREARLVAPGLNVQTFEDPGGHLFRADIEGPEYREDVARLEAMELQSADPHRDAQFWSLLTGWKPVDNLSTSILMQLSVNSPVLAFYQEEKPKPAGVKNSMHLDLRLEADDDPAQIYALVEANGGHELETEWGQLPWKVFQDPSGNEFCILPAPSS